MSDELISSVSGQVTRRGEPEYEAVRTRLVWQERKPQRHPDVIVQAENTGDVIAAVAWAGAHGQRVSARSGGHGWSGSSVRDGGVLIDLGALDEVTIDPVARSATVGPAVTGQRLDALLAPHGLFFPVGHCPTVALGGFLLGGGYGWWSQHYGQACLSVQAVDVVTPDGELIRADAAENSDWLWAARGAGPGFFGIVVRFHLRLHQRPRVMLQTSFLFAGEARESVFRWAWDARRRLDDHIEFAIIPVAVPGATGGEQRAVAVGANVIADSIEQGRQRLEPITGCPLAAQALSHEPARETTLASMFAAQDQVNPPGVRYAVDNMWTSRPVDEVLPLIDEAWASLPTSRSFLLWYHWVPRPLSDVALSSQGEIWLSAYAIYEDPARDEECQRWVTDLMRRYESISDGTQISDENLAARFHLPLSAPHLERLDVMRERYDPSSRTFGLPRPGTSTAAS